MIIAGYFASILIGVSLGLIGGGGSILTVPVLVYLFGIDAVIATTYSLFVVGTTSLAGSASYFKKGLVNLKTAFVFGIPSVASVFITRTFIVPAIPDTVFNMGGILVTKGMLLMLLFAVLMVFASYSMIRKSKANAGQANAKPARYSYVVIQGFSVGVLTGLVGAGGGFLIIPALVNFLKMPIKNAIGTSLVVISINSLTGFLFSLPHISVKWNFLLSVTAIAIVGIIAGSYMATKIDGKKLKPAFGWFVLAMGIYILLKEILSQ